MKLKKRLFRLYKQAQADITSYKMIVYILLALILGFFLFAMVMRYKNALTP